MVSISDIQNGQYYWETKYSHANNTETANDFIENELPQKCRCFISKMKIIWNLYLKMVSIILQLYLVMETLPTIKLILNL